MVSVKCSAPAPAGNALLALLTVIGIPYEYSSTSEDQEPKLEITTTNPFLKDATTMNDGITVTTVTGWMNCITTICDLSPFILKLGDEMKILSMSLSHNVPNLSSTTITTTTPDVSSNPPDPPSELASLVFPPTTDNTTTTTSTVPTATDICLAIWLANFSVSNHPDAALLDPYSHPHYTTILAHDMMQPFLPTRTTPTTTTADADAAAATTTDVATDDTYDDNPIVQTLKRFQIDHSVYGHELCHTVDELVTQVPLADSGDETHTKNLLLRDKKHGLFLLTVLPNAKVNTKDLGTLLNLSGKVNLRMADPSILLDRLQCAPGTLGPLAIVHDNDAGNDDKKDPITIVLDKGLLTKSKIHSHPMRNDASVILTPDALQSYIAQTNHEAVLLDFPTMEEGTTTTAAAAASSAAAPGDKKKSEPSATTSQKNKDNKKQVKKGETLLAVQWKKEENFSMWYSDAITLSEMISYYDISGCYILRPWSYKIWELIQDWFNIEIRKLGVENAYFPLFVTQERLEREKDHVEGFAPEVAWVTKSGDGDLAKPIAIRPTSETIMYPAFSDWIQSHRDLPLKLNQWSNVVRWEFKYPTPFLRSREFLWQEGHTAHATHADADVMVMQALELYRQVYEDLLAVPVIPGYKTEEEKFAGGLQTTTVEAYVPVAGRAIQGATSHNLGQNFGKMFDITFQDETGQTATAWQTSWGLTTRTIGVMVMVHGDNTGLVLPPRVAPLQAVIVPIVNKKFSMEHVAVYCEAVLKDLIDAGIRAKFDDRTMYNPGWKYNHWEQKGVPIRIEVGPRDMELKQARIVVRYNGEKEDMPVEGMGAALVTKLQDIQNGLYLKAKTFRDEHLVHVTEWKDFVPELEKHNLVMTPWCGGEHKDWEEWVKTKSREESLALHGEEQEDVRTATSVAAKTLCIPFKQPELPPGTKCIASGMDATCWILWGRSY